MNAAPDTAPVTVIEQLVCTSCRRGQPADAAGPRPGAALHDALADLGLPDTVRLKPVACLSNCASGCTVVLRGPGRWTYVYGNLDGAAHAPLIAQGAARYRNAAQGLVPWRERPDHFRKNCIVRIPPLEVSQ